MQAILHLNDDGTVAVTSAAPNALETQSILDIARAAVPTGKPFKIVDAADLPDAPQEAWVINEADLTDGVGA
jgi:hypothetical protein